MGAEDTHVGISPHDLEGRLEAGAVDLEGLSMHLWLERPGERVREQLARLNRVGLRSERREEGGGRRRKSTIMMSW